MELTMTLKEAKDFCKQFTLCVKCPASGYGEFFCPLGGQASRFPSDWRIGDFENAVNTWKERICKESSC